MMNGRDDQTALERRNYELSILNSIAEALNRETDLERALRTTLARVAELCDLRAGWIWLLDEETGAPYLAVTQHLPPALTEKPERMSGSTYCYCLDTYLKGDLSGAANIKIVTCTRLKGLMEGTEGLTFHASIPLYAHSRKLGVLNVASSDWRELSPDDLKLLYTIGDLLSMAIERARLFERSMQVGAEGERSRIAREIHDTVAQGLTAIALHLETADALLEAGAEIERVRELVQSAVALARANLKDARRSVMNLRAAPLEENRLPEALEKLVNDYAARYEFEGTFHIHGESRPLPGHIETALYRITQEALSNVARHARANCVTVCLTQTPENVTLLIEDDGQGFDPSVRKEGRFGLVGLNERVHLLGGTLNLRSSKGEGTQVEVIVPLGVERHE